MTQEEIQERNKQIALMLGKELRIIGNSISIWDENKTTSYGLLYHDSWEMLMEAVYHLELKLVKPVNITQGICTIYRGYAGESNEPLVRVDRWRMGSKEFNYDYKKEAVFIAVSDFAKLYNEGKL